MSHIRYHPGNQSLTDLEVPAHVWDELARICREIGHPGRIKDNGYLDLSGLVLTRGGPKKGSEPRMALNRNLLFWDISEDPQGMKLPPDTRVFVDDEQQHNVVGFDVQEGYVRKLCTGERGEGHPSHKHLNQETDRVCELTVRGQVRVDVRE